jgi:cytoskeleton protein RodZ
MSDLAVESSSPGEILRSARERQGLHIAALAAAIKVAPRKLDALEHDRWDELPDATFVRALAQTVCRTLKIDAAPVLALMPPASGLSLESGNGGLNAPFRDRPGRDEPGLSLGAIRPMVLAASVLILAAVALIFVPDGYWSGASFRAASMPVASAASTPPAAASASAVNADGAASAANAAELSASVAAAGLFPPAEAQPAVATATPAAAAAAGVAVGSEALAASAPAGLLQVRTAGVSWVDVRDGGGRVLVSRVVQAGERLELDGPLPLRLTIGNAAATRLDFRGRAVDMAPSTRDNVARIELK